MKDQIMIRLLHLILPALLLVPMAHGQVAVMGELSHDRQAYQGETYEGVIVLRNDSDEPHEAKVYQTDYLFSHDGTNAYDVPGSTDRSNAHWITFSPAHVVVPAHGTAEIAYTVTVPPIDIATLVGSYWSMIMVEGIRKGSPESSLRSEERDQQMGIRQIVRYGVQIATHITGSGMKSVTFLDAKLVRGEEGAPLMQVDIGNNGDLGMRPEVFVELFDQGGSSMGKFAGVRYRIYPGTSIRQQIFLQGVPSGTYKALVVIDDGNDDVFGAEYTLEF
jgi:hypothetical protein